MDVSLPDSPHFRNLVAIVFGLTAGAIVVGSVEAVGHELYPALTELDFDDETQMEQVLFEAPASAFLWVIAAWALGICSGCLVAGVIGASQGTFCCVVLGAIFVFMAVTMLSEIPAPRWFVFFGLLTLVPGGTAGWWLSQKTLDRLRRAG